MKTKTLGLFSALIVIMMSPAFAENNPTTKPDICHQQICKSDCAECKNGTCDKCKTGECKKCQEKGCKHCGQHTDHKKHHHGKHHHKHYVAKAGNLNISGMFMRPTASVGTPTAAYVTIENTGKMADKLLSVSSDIATKTEIHTSTLDTKGVMNMRPAPFLDIPAGGKAVLAPKGTHIMLMNVSEVLTKGTHIPLLLEFEKSGKKMVSFPVRDTMGMKEHCKK